MRLGDLTATVEPLNGEFKAWARDRSRFDSTESKTKQLLGRELAMLGAKRIVVQMGVHRGQIRNDGYLYANAKVNEPGVIVSFDSKHGSQRFPCDTYNRWQDNLRAIALSLEALRKVDRYGVTSDGEQYRGFQSLPAPDASKWPSEFRTDQDALAFLAEHSGIRGAQPRDQFRRAQVESHPDKPAGDAEKFKSVMAAGRRLGLCD